MPETTHLPTLWRSLPADPDTPPTPIDGLRERSAALHWEAKRRTISGFVWGAFFLATFGWHALQARTPLERTGTLICMLGAIFVAYHWRRFAAKNLSDNLPALQFLQAYREELHRQQRLLLGPILLSLLPLVLGIDLAATARHAFRPASLALAAAFTALILGFGWIVARLNAQQLQFRIDEVEATLREAGK